VPNKSSASTHNEETTQAKQSKREYILLQAKIVARWIEGFKLVEQGHFAFRSSDVPHEIVKLDKSTNDDEKFNKSQQNMTNFNFNSLPQTNSPERSTLLNSKMLNIQPLATKTSFNEINLGA